MKMVNFLIANVRLLSVKSKINKLNKKYFATVRSDWEQKKYDEKVYFLLGREGSYQRDYIEYSFLKGSDFMYEFYHILGKDKLNYSLTKIRKN